jgi:hypothetical protein
VKYVRPLLVAGLVASALTILVSCSGTDQAVTAMRAHPLYTIGLLCVILIVVAFAFLRGVGAEPKRRWRRRSSRGKTPKNRNEN